MISTLHPNLDFQMRRWPMQMALLVKAQVMLRTSSTWLASRNWRGWILWRAFKPTERVLCRSAKTLHSSAASGITDCNGKALDCLFSLLASVPPLFRTTGFVVIQISIISLLVPCPLPINHVCRTLSLMVSNTTAFGSIQYPPLPITTPSNIA